MKRFAEYRPFLTMGFIAWVAAIPVTALIYEPRAIWDPSKLAWLFAMGFVGWVVGICATLLIHLPSKLIKFVLAVAVLYLLLYAQPFYSRSPEFLGLAIQSVVAGIILGILVARSTIRANPLGEPDLRPSAALVVASSVYSLLQPILIVVGDPGQFTYLVRTNFVFFLQMIAFVAGPWVIAILVALIPRAQWAAIGLAALPLLLMFNSYVFIPVMAAFILGCYLGKSPVLRAISVRASIILFVLDAVLLALYDGYMQPHVMEGFGNYYPALSGPALFGGLLFPLVFALGALLIRIASRNRPLPL